MFFSWQQSLQASQIVHLFLHSTVSSLLETGILSPLGEEANIQTIPTQGMNAKRDRETEGTGLQRARPELHWAGQAEVSRVRTDKNETETAVQAKAGKVERTWDSGKPMRTSQG